MNSLINCLPKYSNFDTVKAPLVLSKTIEEKMDVLSISSLTLSDEPWMATYLPILGVCGIVSVNKFIGLQPILLVAYSLLSNFCLNTAVFSTHWNILKR